MARFRDGRGIENARAYCALYALSQIQLRCFVATQAGGVICGVADYGAYAHANAYAHACGAGVYADIDYAAYACGTHTYDAFAAALRGAGPYARQAQARRVSSTMAKVLASLRIRSARTLAVWSLLFSEDIITPDNRTSHRSGGVVSGVLPQNAKPLSKISLVRQKTSINSTF